MNHARATPEAVGPYRLNARLGRGGMGEVYSREVPDAFQDTCEVGLARGLRVAQTYWAQQITFGPVFVHAIALAVRDGAIEEKNRRYSGRC